MYEHPPGDSDVVYLPMRQIINLNLACMIHRRLNWEIAAEAIDEWLRKHSPDSCGEPEFAGYQWKGLFLPHETVLRTAFGGKHHHCHVEGERIVYQGQSLSPSGFVGAVGGVRRNAWKSIWVLLPDAKHWQLADHMRVRRQAPRPRSAALGARARGGQRAASGDHGTATAAASVRPAATGTSAPSAAQATPAAQAIQATPAAPTAPEAPVPALVPTASITPPAPGAVNAPPAPPVAPAPPPAAAARAAPRPPAPARRSGPVSSVIAGWARKRRSRRPPSGNAQRLVALLRQELMPYA